MTNLRTERIQDRLGGLNSLLSLISFPLTVTQKGLSCVLFTYFQHITGTQRMLIE